MSKESDILPPEAGASLDGGRVTLDVPLGAGGMGSVWRGRLAYRVAPVAVKVPHLAGLEPAERKALVSRLLDEAMAAGRVTHPNVVRVLASGDCPAYGPYIVYELLEGGSLEERLRSGPLSWEEVQGRLAPQLLGALDALHASGIVHRDVKPDNVFLASDGRFVLGDLGLALFEGRSARTEEGAVVGTPGYLAPERITAPGVPTGPAADIYAAAMVLVRSATGRLPFRETAPAALVSEQIRREIRPRDLTILGLPPAAAAALAGAVTLDPRDRPPSAGALLERLTHPEAVASVAAPTLTVAAPGPFPGRKPALPRSAFPGRRAPVVAGGFIALLLAVLLGARLDRPTEGEGPAPAFADLARALAASSPLVDDQAAGRLRDELVILEARAVPGGARSEESLRALARAVGRVASTTSPVFLLVDDVLRESPTSGVDVAGRGDRLVSAQLAYASNLLADPGRASSSLRLLTLLTARVGPLLLAKDDPLEAGGPLDAVSVAAYGVLASLPGKARVSPRGRSLSTVLELLLSRANPSREVPSAVAAQALGLQAADPSLDPEVATLAAALRTSLASDYSPEAVAAMAEPALARRAVRRLEIADLRAGRIDDLVRVVADDDSREAQTMRGVVGRAIDDWYRILPAVSQLSTIDRGGPSLDLWYLSSDILLRGGDVRRLRPLAPLGAGPFRPRPLGGRVSVMMVGLAESAVAGDREAMFQLHRDLDDWLKGLKLSRLLDTPPFVATVRTILGRSPRAKSAVLSLDGILASLTGRTADGAELGAEACDAALDWAENQGDAVTTEELQAVVDCLARLRYVALSDRAIDALHGCRERTVGILSRVHALGSVTRAKANALDELTEELKKPLSPLLFGEEGL